MTRFDMTQWADFLRGTLSADQQQQMDAHLENGASKASLREIAALRRVMQLAETDRQLEIPEHAVRCAKALGSLRRPQAETVGAEATGALAGLKKIVMSLTFDSFTTAEVGVRDIRSADRQLIFESDGLVVDLRIEPGSGGSNVVGQLIRETPDMEPLADVPMLAVGGEKILTRATTSEFGEFQAEGLPSSATNLLFLVGDEKCLEIPLGAGDETAEPSR